MAASTSTVPADAGMDMLYSGVVAGLLAYGSFKLLSSGQVGAMLGSEALEVFIGLGATSVLAPMVVSMAKSQSVPQLPSMGKATAMDFLYGGAIGTAFYYGWNVIMPGYDPAIDVAVSAVAAGAAAPYLTFLKPY